jgi:hypothetical protein
MTSTNREYIATKSFFAGEINLKINEQERIRFDGFKALIRGQEYKCSTLMAAIRAGLLLLAHTDASGKPIEQTEPVKESAEQKAKRLKEERLRSLNGAKGNGEILEEITVKPSKIVKRDGTPVGSSQPAVSEEKSKKKEKRSIIQETEGLEVAKVAKSTSGVEEDSSKSFYESLLDGEKKKLEVAKDQFAAKKVVKKDNQDDAVEVKKLVESVGDASEITPKKDPLKTWKSMTVKKKEAFIKKQTDISLIKRIIDSEGGSIRRKAEERLAEVDHAKDVGQHP